MEATLDPVIKLRGHNAVTRGIPAEVLDGVLTVNVISCETDQGGVLHLTRNKLQLYGPLSDLDHGELVFPAGLAKRVEAHLSERGHRVQVEDQTRWLALEQAGPPAAQQDPGIQRWCEIFSTLPRAQIVVRSRRRMIEAIGTCALVHPAAKILVVTKSNSDAKAIAAGLEEIIPDRVQRLGPGTRWCDCIVLVTNSYHPVGPGNQQFGIVIYVGPETPMSQIGQLEAAKMHGQLRYCVRYPWRRDVTPYEELHVEAACGPVEYVERSSKYRTLQVWLVRSEARRKPQGATLAERKRNAYGDNRERNTVICRAVEAIKARDAVVLAQLGLAAREARRFVEHLPADPGVAIVVESLRHARALQRSIPSAIIRGQGDADWSARAVCDVSLLTETFARRVPIIAEVIVRATGGTSPLELLQGRGLDRYDAPQIVVDVWDDFDPSASAKRAARYREQGAEVIFPAMGRQQPAQTRRSRKS